MDDQRVQQATERLLHDPVVTGLRSALAGASFRSLYLVGGALRDACLGLETKDFICIGCSTRFDVFALSKSTIDTW